MPSQTELLNTITEDYLPGVYGSSLLYSNTLGMNQPRFSIHYVPLMITDPRVLFGSWLVKGPLLSKARFFVRCGNPTVKEFLKTNITRFWRNSASRALKAVDWGYSGSEVLYRMESGFLHFDTLKDLDSLDLRAVTYKGKICGMTVQNSISRQRKVKKTYVGGNKAFWHTHWRDVHPFYGRSRFYGAFRPWLETWTDGGAKASRRLFFHKYAFDGGTLYHPPGSTRLDGNAVETEVPNKLLAQRLLDKKRNGGTLTLPSQMLDGVVAWRYEPPQSAPPPTGLMEYGQQLADEIWEGMCIPSEIARAEGTGAYAGRAIPMEAYYSLLQDLVQWLITDADVQIFNNLVRMNFGAVPYEIIPLPLGQVAAMQSGEVEDEQENPQADADSEQELSLSIVVDSLGEDDGNAQVASH